MTCLGAPANRAAGDSVQAVARVRIQHACRGRCGPAVRHSGNRIRPRSRPAPASSGRLPTWRGGGATTAGAEATQALTRKVIACLVEPDSWSSDGPLSCEEYVARATDRLTIFCEVFSRNCAGATGRLPSNHLPVTPSFQSARPAEFFVNSSRRRAEALLHRASAPVGKPALQPCG